MMLSRFWLNIYFLGSCHLLKKHFKHRHKHSEINGEVCSDGKKYRHMWAVYRESGPEGERILGKERAPSVLRIHPQE